MTQEERNEKEMMDQIVESNPSLAATHENLPRKAEVVVVSIEAGELTLKESGFPILEIKLQEHGLNPRTFTGYLSPFRGYKFQVSATPDGQGDLGSGVVIGLANIFVRGIRMTHIGKAGNESNVDIKGINIEMLTALALRAVVDFVGYPFGRLDDELEHLAVQDFKLLPKSTNFRNFINACFNYLYE